MQQVFYTSRLVDGTSPAEISRIVGKWRSLNREAGITSLLVFDGSAFAQYLEGPVGAVLTTFMRIQDDDRHLGLVTRHEAALDGQRRFGAWSLGFGLVHNEPALERLDDRFGTAAIEALIAMLPSVDLHV